MTKYRIMTEDKNRKGIQAILDRYLDGYTLTCGLGFWKGRHEKALIVEIIPRTVKDHPRVIRRIAQGIRALNRQEAVLIEKSSVQVEMLGFDTCPFCKKDRDWFHHGICPHCKKHCGCSFSPTSFSDYCEEHQPLVQQKGV